MSSITNSVKMSYATAVSELEQLGIMPDTMPSLDPIRRALKRTGLDRLMDPSRNVVIAGTNGKGSVAATLSALMVSADYRTGLYTSPHLVTTCERIRVDERDVSEQNFAAAYQSLKTVILEEKLTHFEAVTLIAAAIFYSGDFGKPLEWGIWEVGMGGLFDATNAIPHEFCGITRLGIDHRAILGNTLEEIAVQKLGIVGNKNTVVFSPMDGSLTDLRFQIAHKTDSQWRAAKPVELLSSREMGTPWGRAHTSLAGPRAAENTATALTLFEAMVGDPKPYLSALRQVRWPGRFSRLDWPHAPCPVYLSGDHNVQGVESLIRILDNYSWKTIHVVAGMGFDKDVTPMLDLLTTLPRSRLYLTETPFKPMRLDAYPPLYLSMAVDKGVNTEALLGRVMDRAEPGDLIVVTGSLYLVGHVLGVSMTREHAKATA